MTLRIRLDVLFVSSVLLTIALVALVPAAWENALAGRYTADRIAGQEAHDLGIAGLAIISISLIVIWTGYIKGLRSAWFIMSIVVWAWAFPGMGLWKLNYSNPLQGLSEAVKGPGLARAAIEMAAIEALMMIGLFVPAKAFFFGKKSS
jgi:hypothetical protein